MGVELVGGAAGADWPGESGRRGAGRHAYFGSAAESLLSLSVSLRQEGEEGRQPFEGVGGWVGARECSRRAGVQTAPARARDGTRRCTRVCLRDVELVVEALAGWLALFSSRGARRINLPPRGWRGWSVFFSSLLYGGLFARNESCCARNGCWEVMFRGFMWVVRARGVLGVSFMNDAS